MNVFEGSIVSCDATGAVHRFLVEERGKIVFVGDLLPPAFAAMPRTQLGEGALLPAFADTHLHFMSHALFASKLDIREAGTIEALCAMLHQYAATCRDTLLFAFGASAHAVQEGRLVRREDLDTAVPDRPVYLVKYDGHAAIANSALLKQLPAEVRTARGYNADSGLLEQEAFFLATDWVTSKVSLPQTLQGMLRAADGLAEKGIGLLHSVSGVGFPLDMDVMLERLFARGLRNPMTYRVFFQTMDIHKVLRRGLPRIGGCFATALDGCFGSVDAALNQPYAHDASSRGVLYYSDEQVRDFAIKANREGLQIAMHAIGDRAFDQAVKALEAALQDYPRTDHRHTIIHACLPTQQGLETCARLGIVFAVQPAFLDWPQEPLPYLHDVLGERAYKLSPLNSFKKAGIVMTGGSDAPCTMPDPLASIQAACTHYVQAEALDVQSALNMFTRDAAYGAFDEAKRGSLEAGKIADMVLLGANPLSCAVDQIASIPVTQLYLSGKPYKAGQGLGSLLLRGLFSRRAT